MGINDAEQVEFTSRAAWRRWLKKHHQSEDGIWAVTYKRHVTGKHVPLPDMVKEAICFGWIDCRNRRVDDDRTSIYVTPRKPRGLWSAVNKKHIEELTAQGLIEDAGQAVIDAAKADGSWSFLDDIDAVIEPDDLRTALDQTKKVRRFWDSVPASVRKRVLYDIKVAKTEATRQKRIKRTVDRCRRGERPA